MRHRHGFSLLELLVTISIISVMVALLLVATGLVRNAAKTIRCQSNQRQIGLAIQTYLDLNEGWYPTSRQDNVAGVFGSQVHWFEHLLQYLDTNEAGGGSTIDRRDLQGVKRNVFKDCPAWKSTTVYAYGYGMNGCLRQPASVLRNMWDVTAGTFLDYNVRQVTNQPTRTLVADSPDWHITVSNSKYPDAWSPLRHRTGANYLFCDMHVQTLRQEVAELSVSNPALVR